MTTFETIAKAFRFNSGRNPFDSGDHYGRHYDKLPIDEKSPTVTINTYKSEVTATIESAHFLSERCDVDDDITKQFDEWVALEENADLSWFDAGKQFATEVLSLSQCVRDNTYNSENDLSQDYVWEVYSDSDLNDWIHDSDALLMVYAHTGCDIRGGYSHPIFLRSNGDYSVPIDLVTGFSISEGRRDGKDLSMEECQELDEQWQCGYSSQPSYQFSKDIERVFSFTKTVDSVIVKLKSGEIVKVYANAINY